MNVKNILKKLKSIFLEIIGVLSFAIETVTLFWSANNSFNIISLFLITLFMLLSLVTFVLLIYKTNNYNNRIRAFQYMAYYKKLHSLGLVLLHALFLENCKTDNPANIEFSSYKTLKIKKAIFNYYVNEYDLDKKYADLDCEYNLHLKNRFNKALDFNFLVLRDTGSKSNDLFIDIINKDQSKSVLGMRITPQAVIPRDDFFERDDDIDFYSIKESSISLKNVAQINIKFKIRESFDLYNKETLVVYPYNYARTIDKFSFNLRFQKNINDIVDTIYLKSIDLNGNQKNRFNDLLQERKESDQPCYSPNSWIKGKKTNSIFFVETNTKKCQKDNSIILKENCNKCDNTKCKYKHSLI